LEAAWKQTAPAATAEARRGILAAMLERPALDHAWRDHPAASICIALTTPLDPATTPPAGKKRSRARPPNRRTHMSW